MERIGLLPIDIPQGFSSTHNIANKGFNGLQMFAARKKVQCSLIRNRLVIPHDTIPSTLATSIRKIHDR
jgi:hypothetical protein